LNQVNGGVDGDNVKELEVPRMQSAKTDGKYICNKVKIREANIKIKLNKQTTKRNKH
jgi:hypothetical protein